jgi:putative MATE family efflux protein
MSSEAKLTKGPVGKTLAGLALPMVGGILAIVGFNLADTFYVSQLGTRELAAMSFTFPVVMVLMGIAMGLGTGTTSAVSRAIGRGDRKTVQRISSDSLSLSLLVVMFSAGAGILTIDPLFALLGAGPDILPLIRDYMSIWYLGVVFLVVPMVANASIRASGDTRIPALIMVGATGSNLILDPILIFGWFGLPAMGLKGAALATVIARAGTMVASLLILHFRERVLDFSRPDLRQVWLSWKQILHIAIPAATTNVLQPLGIGIVTRLVATYGPSTVAAWGAGSRIAAFSLIPVFGLCSGLVPFVGQNWGAGAYDRVRQARKLSYLFSFVWGLVTLVALHFAARPLAGLFSEDPEVVREIVRFLWIIPAGFALVGILSVTEETLNAIGKPLFATLQTLVHMFVIYVPFAFAGSMWLSITGLLAGLAAADILGGCFGLLLVRSICSRDEQCTDESVVPDQEPTTASAAI